LLKTSECEFATDVLLIWIYEDRVCSSELARTAPINPGGQSANIPVKMMTSFLKLTDDLTGHFMETFKSPEKR
jgi:hypothetical protein